MEQLKKELKEKGYTFFKLQDYNEFKDDYEYYKKYKCDKNTNLLNHIKSLRMDARYLNGEPASIKVICNNFEEIEKKANEEYLPLLDDKDFKQYWFYGEPSDIQLDFKKLIYKIVNNLYDVSIEKLDNLTQLTYYKQGCFLTEHNDGTVLRRLCAVLIYLNDEEYKSEWGGNIVFERKETIIPIYGNIAILDFKDNNCLHEVKKVVDGYGRYAILSFVSLGQSDKTPNHY